MNSKPTLHSTFDHYQLILGGLQTNVYVLKLKSSCLVVDPASKSDALRHLIKSCCPGLPVDIFLTHGHSDHISGVPDLIKAYPNAKIYLSKAETKLTRDSKWNLSEYIPPVVDLKSVEGNMEFVKDGDVLKGNFKVLETPGHTPGHIALYSEKDSCVFSGDTLFRESVGNCALPLGNEKLMMKSIREKLFTLPEKTTVYPGHGEETTIGYEKQNNPFFAWK